MLKFQNQQLIKSPIFLFLSFFVFLFLFFPLPTFAWAVDLLINAVMYVPTLMIATALGILVLISSVFAHVTGWILDVVISPAFVNLSYTVPCPPGPPGMPVQIGIPTPGGAVCNPIIAIGLSITQSFVNLGLVIALVVIAIATALRLGSEYHAQKALVRLIIVALLVNFAPVIIGIIVDAANIVMHYFLGGIKEGASGMSSLLKSHSMDIATDLIAFRGDLADRLGLLASVATAALLNFAIGIAFFLFAFIFIVRYVVIWTLVILAPVAFVCWILPVTQGLWKQWVTQLTQWAIIGIPVAFFLYLAMSTFGFLMGTFMVKDELAMPGIEAPDQGFFNQVFPFFVIIVFLYLGLTIGLQTGAMSGEATIKFAQKIGTWGAKTTGRAGRRTASRMLGAKGKDWLEEQASATFIPESVRKRGFLAKAAYSLTAPVTGAVWAARRGIGEAGLKLTEAGIKDIGAAEEKYKGTTAERKLAGIRDALRIRDFGKAAGILRKGIDEEQIDDLRDLGLKNDEITKIGKETLRVDPEQFKKIRNTFPVLAEKMGEGFSDTFLKKIGLESLAEEEIKEEITIPMRIMTKIRPDFIPSIDKTSFSDEGVQKYFHSKLATAGQVSAFLEKGPARVKKSFIEKAQENGIEYYEEKNPGVANYFKNNPGIRALGAPLPRKKPSEEEIRKAEEERRKEEQWEKEKEML